MTTKQTLTQIAAAALIASGGIYAGTQLADADLVNARDYDATLIHTFCVREHEVRPLPDGGVDTGLTVQAYGTVTPPDGTPPVDMGEVTFEADAELAEKLRQVRNAGVQRAWRHAKGLDSDAGTP